jgi:predicted O-methyltransferase YrrM
VTLLNFHSFFAKFGGSARTKHILAANAEGAMAGPRGGKRLFVLPEQSKIPKEFIRLCPWEMEYLFTVARRARKGVLETGRYNGGSLFVMACATRSEVPLYSVDIAPQNDELLRELLALHIPAAKVDLIVGDSQKTTYPQVGEIDVLFIDGDHSYEGCWNDTVNWYHKLAVNGHLLFHDSYLGSYGVQDAIMDFMQDHPELAIVQSPFIGADHWHYPAGSIAHLIKRGTTAG